MSHSLGNLAYFSKFYFVTWIYTTTTAASTTTTTTIIIAAADPPRSHMMAQ